MTYELGQVTAKVQGQICELEQGRVEIQSLKVDFSWKISDSMSNFGVEELHATRYLLELA